MNLAAIQDYMRGRRIDAWLVYDFRGSNPILGQLLPGKRWTTRRALLLIPAAGEPTLLAHSIDAHQFDNAQVARDLYLSWQDLHAWLARRLANGGGAARVAMEYAPGGALPVVGIVDAGTIEMVRAARPGVEIVSSADLIQVSVAMWSADAQKSHAIASQRVAAIKDGAFALIRDQLAQGRSITERQVQQHILAQFTEQGLETPEPPIVAVNAHSGDPHFEVPESGSSPIRRGDWVLIDLWARLPGDENIFSDITWVGHAGKDVPARNREVFNTVKAARDASVRLAQESWAAKRPVQGWQLDDAARNVIIDAGFGQFVRHRTGHSLSPGPKVHGLGVNLDNLETHDTREVLPGVGWTVEPGIYTPEFGVRLEINMFADPVRGPVVTSCVQDEIVLMG